MHRPYLGYSMLVLLQFVLANLYAQPNNVLGIPYCNQAIVVDGDLAEWESKPVARFMGPISSNHDANRCEVFLAWDETNLYLAARVFDSYLVGLESPQTLKRLHYNDSFEFYIDTKNDSRDTMDFNDYQFLFDLHGACAVFTSDPLDSALKYRVPKEIGIANVVVKTKSQFKGTSNYNGDTDAFYTLECIIPWEGIGVIPQKGLGFKADFCLNDNDTIVDFKMLEPGPIQGYGSISFQGFHDFGYPNKWSKLRLIGSASFFKKMTVHYADNWLLFLFFSIGCGSLAVLAFFIKLKRPAQPIRNDEHDQQLIHYLLQNEPEPEKPLPNQAVFDKAKEFVTHNLTELITVEQLAAVVGLGIRQTQRLFKSGLNTTPTAFVLAIKLEHAAQLLTTTQKNVAEVAYAVGFSDPSYFSRTFKRYFGIAPSDYQKQKLS